MVLKLHSSILLASLMYPGMLYCETLNRTHSTAQLPPTPPAFDHVRGDFELEPTKLSTITLFILSSQNLYFLVAGIT